MELTLNISAIVAIIGALTVLTNIIVEVLKRATWEKMPTNLLAIIVAMVLTLVAFFGYMAFMGYAVMWYYVAAAVVVGFAVAYAAMFGFDKNPVTSFRNSGKTSFSVVPGTKAYTMLLNVEPGNAVKFNQYDKKGKLLASTDINNSFFNVELNKKAAKAEIEGNVEVFEIIAK